MEKSKNFFIKIDEFIFQRLDFFKTDSSFQKGIEILSGLEEKQQKLFAQIITFSFILIPFIFVITLWWGNHTTKVNLAVKTQILEQISTLNANKEARDNISSTYLAPNAIQGKEDLVNKIRSLISVNNIDDQKVHVVNFNQFSSTSNIAKIEATLSFTNFGIQDFSTFTRALIEREKFKILRINMTKNKTTNLLNGDISLIHLGKSIY